MTLDRLKNFVAAKNDLDELVALSAFAVSLSKEYQSLSVDQPAWLSEAQRGIANEVRARVQDELQRKLTSARARYETLKTPSERRRETEEEIQRLEAAIGG